VDRLKFYIVWCLLGAALFLAGCRVSVTAEKLEASWEIRDPTLQVTTEDILEID